MAPQFGHEKHERRERRGVYWESRECQRCVLERQVLEAGTRITTLRLATQPRNTRIIARMLLRIGKLIAEIRPEQLLLCVFIVNCIDPIIIRINNGGYDEHFALDSFGEF